MNEEKKKSKIANAPRRVLDMLWSSGKIFFPTDLYLRLPETRQTDWICACSFIKQSDVWSTWRQRSLFHDCLLTPPAPRPGVASGSWRGSGGGSGAALQEPRRRIFPPLGIRRFSSGWSLGGPWKWAWSFRLSCAADQGGWAGGAFGGIREWPLPSCLVCVNRFGCYTYFLLVHLKIPLHPPPYWSIIVWSNWICCFLHSVVREPVFNFFFIFGGNFTNQGWGD